CTAPPGRWITGTCYGQPSPRLAATRAASTLQPGGWTPPTLGMPPGMSSTSRTSRGPSMIQYEDVPVPNRSPDEMGTAELVRAAYAQVSTLVRDEIALAKLELAGKGTEAGIGAGVVRAAGTCGFSRLGPHS